MVIYARKPKVYNKKEKRTNYKHHQYKPDSSDEYVVKEPVDCILYLSPPQIESYGWKDGQNITGTVYINKISEQTG